MKIAIDCRMIGSGGIGSYISALLPFFIKNNECILFGKTEDLKEYSNFSNVQIIPCKIKTFSLKELLFFPKQILQTINTCDVYYSPYCNIPKGIKIPVYTTIHDVVFLDVKNLASLFGTIIRKWFYQNAINKSKLVFTVSNFSKERIIANLRADENKIITTYNALPPWFYNDINISMQKENFILFVGNIKKHKGLKTLLNAYKIVLENFIDAKLVIVGNAENFRTGDENIWNIINDFPPSSIKFTGRISDSQLKETYSKAKVLVQPSLYEGFGMPPLEALSLDTDVILSDIPVFKEIYEGFPVTFFKCQNESDLAQKIIEGWNSFGTKSISVPEKYSFDKTYDIIISNLK